jgi:thioredoxin 1
MNDPASPSSSSAAPASQPRPGKFNFWRWFWLGTIPVSLVWVWFDFYVPANHITWAKDHASARQQAARSGRPIILFFTAKWCVPCRIMKRNVWADEQVERVVSAKFTPVMIDMDDPDGAGTVGHYNVLATPATIITDPQGNVLERTHGGMGREEFLGLLGKVDPDRSKARSIH